MIGTLVGCTETEDAVAAAPVELVELDLIQKYSKNLDFAAYLHGTRTGERDRPS